jgi:hypothetical protein
MQIKPLRALIGWRWVKDGFRLLGRQPIALLAISFINLTLLSLSVMIPLIGAVGPLLLTPALMVGLMHAIRCADTGRMPSIRMLFAGFRDSGGTAWRPLLVLGAFNAAATLAVLGVAALADGGALMKIVTGQMREGDVPPDETSLFYAGIIFIALYTPVQMSMWYAPLLVAWHRISPMKALFYSLFAVLRNKWAFVVFAIGWFAVAFIGSLGVRLLGVVIGDSPLLLSMILSPLSLALITAVYCSFWPTYRDAVDDAQTAVPPQPGRPA